MTSAPLVFSVLRLTWLGLGSICSQLWTSASPSGSDDVPERMYGVLRGIEHVAGAEAVGRLDASSCFSPHVSK